MAEAVAEGADAGLLAIDADGNLRERFWDKRAAADAIVLDSPTYLGSFSGAMAQSPADAGVDEMPAGDLEDARRFGTRVRRSAEGLVAR